MSLITILFGGATGALFLYIAYKKWNVNRATQKRDREIYEKTKPIIEALENQREPDTALIQELADDPASRTFVFVLLDGHGKLDLFPEKYDNFVSSAEAALVYWLLHPNELGARPPFLKYVKKINLKHEFKEKKETLSYYVFKFKEDREADPIENPWRVGISGPYLSTSNPYDFVPGTYSTFEEFDSKSPKEHVEELHELCLEKKLF